MLSVPGMGGTTNGADVVGNTLGCSPVDSDRLKLGAPPLSVPGMGVTAVGADAISDELGCLLEASNGLELGAEEGLVPGEALGNALGSVPPPGAGARSGGM